MKLLLDTCVWGGLRVPLKEAGHDFVWAGDWPEDPGDVEILDRAHRDGRILVTLDKDFGELAIRPPDTARRHPPTRGSFDGAASRCVSGDSRTVFGRA